MEKLNNILITALPHVLRLTHAELASKVEINEGTWYRISKDPKRITVQQLIMLANGLHIPVRHFFTTDIVKDIGVEADYVVNDGYQLCYYDPKPLLQRVKVTQSISLAEVAKVTGMHENRVLESFSAVRRLPVLRLLHVCSAFKIDPFLLLVDPNKKKRKQNTVNTEVLGELELLQEKTAKMSEEVESLHRRCDMLEQQLHWAMALINERDIPFAAETMTN